MTTHGSPPSSPIDRLAGAVAGRWRLVVLTIWLLTCAQLLWTRWPAIHWFALGDTDDNMRFLQVRDWLAGQRWSDLRQHRMNPPAGFDIHWSRLVDLPIAALYLIARPFLRVQDAWRFACAIAPMLPLGAMMAALAVTVRRLVSPYAYPIALVLVTCGPGLMAMVSPLRIDHHGWQLALLMASVAGLCDPRPVRSGVTVALASALSLTIGLEMLPYAVFAGAAIALRWACGDDARRMRAYAATLLIATPLLFLVFASNDNWALRCDALTPVWTTTVCAAAALLLVAAATPVRSPVKRAALVAAAGGATLAIYALAFPQCFSHRLENVPPEAAQLWLSHVREARSILRHPRDVTLPAAALPAIGAIAALLIAWRLRGTARLAEWAPVLLFAPFAGALMFWQFRTAPSAQMLAVPAVTWLAWEIAARAEVLRWPRWQWGLAAAVLATVAGLLGPLSPPRTPRPGKVANGELVRLANRRCPTIPALRPVGRLPTATMFSFIDVGPRLIALTHHRAVAGPYHRNAAAILDVEHAFRGSPAAARAIMARHGADYLLVCPNLSESTIYRSEAPHGFYAQLAAGRTPGWLAPVELPKGNPWRLWRIAR